MKKLTPLFALVVVMSMLLSACGTPATPTAAPATDVPTTAAAQPTDVPAVAAPTDTAAAAAPTETPAPTANPNALITFWSWVPHIEDQVAEWNTLHPDMQVNYVNSGGGNGNYTKLKVALQANTGIPDVVQIEYQHLPNYIAQGVLLDLSGYGANDVKSQFIPWTWSQVSQGTGVYAYPQDAGPMVMFCNTAVLDKYGITAPTTWDEFTAAAAKLHKADPNAYLSNFTADQGWFFGMLWQSGAQPFIVDGQKVAVNFTSPEVTRVAKLWGDLIKSGNLSPVDTYTNDWNTALGNGSVACWQAGAWGTFISGSSPNYKGKWKIFQLPQWTAGGKANGNYGGSTITVMKATTHPKEAAAFAQWLTTDPKVTMEVTAADKAALFPVTSGVLTNPAWANGTDDFWSSQAIHQVMATAANQVNVTFGWSPFTDFVYTTYADELVQIKAGSVTFDAAMKDLQDKVVAYAKDQGFTVTTP
jgi:multiple sugar transport system substrate-binding protein